MAQPAPPTVGELRAHLMFLSDDLLEGRGVGTRGGHLAELYVESAFRAAGLAPAFGESYRQELTLRRVLPDKAMTTRLGGVALAFGPDLVATFPVPREPQVIDAKLAYVGYGIVSKEWNWDDYKDVDVRGRVVLVNVNEPGRDDPALFDGPALTYYGRWTYKLEEAQRHGAIGVLLVHDEADAGYSWDVARNSWSGAEYFDPTRTDLLPFEGWITKERARALVPDAERQTAERRAFRPRLIDTTLHVEAKPTSETVVTANVAGIVRGTGAGPRRTIVLSAHHDHLGTDDGAIYHGAVDNGSALAVLLGLARSYAAAPSASDVLFLACAAEEQGLLGSRYFVEHWTGAPLAANVNFEMTSVWGRADRIVAIGARQSPAMGGLVGELAAAHELTLVPEPTPQQGYFYRSDQFSFFRRGIPAVWLDLDQPAERKTYRETMYHKPADRYDPAWPLAGTRQVAELAIELVERLERH